ncbi:MAG: cytochrome c peroxidase [Verrucomicrobiota bacterium]
MRFFLLTFLVLWVPLSLSALPPQGRTKFREHPAAKVELGRLLFFDKILSGNRNISCATCHHPLNATGDGLPLGIGQGGRGLGLARSLENISLTEFETKHRIPRNAPALFNLGAEEFRVLFHDGRVEKNIWFTGGFRTPAGEDTPLGLESTLAAQALFPPTSAEEMAGHPGENPIADAAAEKRLAGPGGVWDLLAQRLRANDDYVAHFRAAFPDLIEAPEDIHFVHAANAIAAFEANAFRSDRAPYDHFMAGDLDCLSPNALSGMQLFFGKAQCARCHSGPFQTDHRFHALAMPQIGPGKGDGPGGAHDFGREQVTRDEKDRFRFRTPSLRNVTLTAPYGHCGTFQTLEETIRHHLSPARSLASFQASELPMPNTGTCQSDDCEILHLPSEVKALADRAEIQPVSLTDEELADLVSFLHCLTDPNAGRLAEVIPLSVPSGLPIYD